MFQAPAFVCPLCGRASWHPKDAEHRFCGVCGFTEDVFDRSWRHWLLSAVMPVDDIEREHPADDGDKQPQNTG